MLPQKFKWFHGMLTGPCCPYIPFALTWCLDTSVQAHSIHGWSMEKFFCANYAVLLVWSSLVNTQYLIFYALLFFPNPFLLSEATYIMWPVGIYTCSQALKPKRCGKAKENLRKVVVWYRDFHGEGWHVQMSYCEAVITTIDCFSCYLQILWKCTDKYEVIWCTLQLLLAI